MTNSLYYRVRTSHSLHNAWRIVHGNGITSKSEITRRQIKEFDQDSVKYITRIQRQLLRKTFKFLPSEGIQQKKPGKSSIRPIVKSPITNRIVQRSILDVLQSHPPIAHYFTVKTSFGGIKDRGVSDALRTMYESIQAGAKYYLRSDIEAFFTKIPKPTMLSIIGESTTDTEFLELLKNAITTELSNLEQLGAEKYLFPIYDIGVAQGSCLSPLLGNILLNEFDIEMNQGDITCIRYIDDFIILAPSLKALNAAFKKAIKLLSKHELTAYDPKEDYDKAEIGKTSSTISFLGCEVRPGIIRPNRRSQKRLLENIDEIFNKSIELMDNPEQLVKKHRTLTETLSDVNNIMKGWGNQYAFCNDPDMMRRVDAKIDEKIAKYLSHYAAARSRFEKITLHDNRRRLLGVHLLTDSKKDPIIKSA
jgi:retron-type reverse transcriptase